MGNSMLTFFDICSGIGGGRLGLEQCNFECIGYSDTSRLAKTTYNLMHDTSNEYFCNNINKLNESNTPKHDILIAGFPCQSFSVIGRKDGFDDKRGQIIFTIANILFFSKPRYFILENVKGLVTHNKGNTLKVILERLEESGYKVYYKVLTTLNYGIPQNRQRVYFVGIRNDIFIKEFEWPDEVKLKCEIKDFFSKEKKISDINLMYLNKYLDNQTNKGKYAFEDLLKLNNSILDTRMNDMRIYIDKMPTLRSQRDGIYYICDNQIYELTGSEALLFQGFPKEKINLVNNNVTNRHLLMQAGNAMSVNVIKAIGDSLKKYEEAL